MLLKHRFIRYFELILELVILLSSESLKSIYSLIKDVELYKINNLILVTWEKFWEQRKSDAFLKPFMS